MTKKRDIILYGPELLVNSVEKKIGQIDSQEIDREWQTDGHTSGLIRVPFSIFGHLETLKR